MAIWAGVVLLLIAAYPLASCIDAWITGMRGVMLYYPSFSLSGEGISLFSIGETTITYKLSSFLIDRILLLTITFIIIFIAIGLLVSEKKTLRIVR